MDLDFNKWGPATVLVVIAALIVLCVGGAVVIWGHEGALSFEDYLNDIIKVAGALGVLGIGRGLHAGLVAHGHGRRAR